MPRHQPSSPPAPAELPAERLCDAVTDLTQYLSVLVDVLDDIREDLRWITRNGIPGGRPIEHTRVVRMARDPLASNAHKLLELRTYTLEPRGSPAVTPEVFENLVSEVAEAMTVVGQEQLNMFLTALDEAREKLLAAIKNPATASAANDKPASELRQPSSRSNPTIHPSAAELGRLF